MRKDTPPHLKSWIFYDFLGPVRWSRLSEKRRLIGVEGRGIISPNMARLFMKSQGIPEDVIQECGKAR